MTPSLPTFRTTDCESLWWHCLSARTAAVKFSGTAQALVKNSCTTSRRRHRRDRPRRRVLGMELAYQVGSRVKGSATDDTKGHINATQASTLGILALLLAFTFSLSLQRFETRSDAMVDEANAIGTAYLRAQMLPARAARRDAALLRDYVDLRVGPATSRSSRTTGWAELMAKAGSLQNALWEKARRAAEIEPEPGHFGDLRPGDQRPDRQLRQARRCDPPPRSGSRAASCCSATFLITGAIVGFRRGVVGQRPPLGQLRHGGADRRARVRHPRPGSADSRPDHGQREESSRPAGIDEGRTARRRAGRRSRLRHLRARRAGSPGPSPAARQNAAPIEATKTWSLRPGVEPEAADRDAPPRHLHERPALDVAVAAVGPRALGGQAEAQRLDRAKAELAPGVEIAVAAGRGGRARTRPRCRSRTVRQPTLASTAGTNAFVVPQAPPSRGVSSHVIVSPPEKVQPTKAERAPIDS